MRARILVDCSKLDIDVIDPLATQNILYSGTSASLIQFGAIISLLFNRPMRSPNITATGVMTLSPDGRILPVGSLNQKLIAAHKKGISHILIPYDNLGDLDSLDP